MSYRGCYIATVALSVAAFVLVGHGCTDSNSADQTVGDSDGATATDGKRTAKRRIRPRRRVAGAQPATGEPVAPLSNIDRKLSQIPQVVMSQAHAATCLASVGDSFPNVTLPTPDGQTTSISETLGNRLTVVVFWSSTNLYSVAELEELSADVAARFGQQDVRIVAINVGETAEEAQATIGELGLDLVVLLDEDRAVYNQVATDLLPRTFLLGPEGRILWLDLEYSRTTRRSLLQAIEYLVGEA